jgi:hypothetical protein
MKHAYNFSQKTYDEKQRAKSSKYTGALYWKIIGIWGLNQVLLAEGRFKQLAQLNTVMYLQVTYKAGGFIE